MGSGSLATGPRRRSCRRLLGRSRAGRARLLGNRVCGTTAKPYVRGKGGGSGLADHSSGRECNWEGVMAS